MNDIQKLIAAAWDNRELLANTETQDAIRHVIEELDKGRLRVAQPNGDTWQVNEWVKKAVVMYFPIQKMKVTEAGPMEFS
jgi:2,3,4,5-tetrahydropyridine-2-carboxylate N-succinyltransferase